MNSDIYERITGRIVADLARGVRPWMKPWNAEHAAGRITQPLRHNGLPYQGINVIMLWSAAVEKSYAAPIWMTFRQAKELGGFVRKGETGELVVYADRIRKTEIDETTGDEVRHEIPFMKGYTVFNVEQIDGLPPHFHVPAETTLDPVERIERAEAFFAATRASISHGGNMAFYTMAQERVQMPPFETFRDPVGYYATLAHECSHWTRHPSRLDRDFGRKR